VSEATLQAREQERVRESEEEIVRKRNRDWKAVVFNIS
jgi:hypothetical protein